MKVRGRRFNRFSRKCFFRATSIFLAVLFMLSESVANERVNSQTGLDFSGAILSEIGHPLAFSNLFSIHTYLLRNDASGLTKFVAIKYADMGSESTQFIYRVEGTCCTFYSLNSEGGGQYLALSYSSGKGQSLAIFSYSESSHPNVTGSPVLQKLTGFEPRTDNYFSIENCGLRSEIRALDEQNDWVMISETAYINDLQISDSKSADNKCLKSMVELKAVE